MATFLSYIFMNVVKIKFEMSVLVICKIFRGFVNTLTSDEKYFLCNSENFL